jgi:RimJ/RimL family protein N-acetyltransferase
MRSAIELRTDRLILREATEEDAPFFLDLLNQPEFVRFIGDRGVRNLRDAREYVRSRLIASYECHGFGLWIAVRQTDGAVLGICGLVKRDTLPDVDIGFAFLPRHGSRGYALESARAVLDWARGRLGLRRIVAITDPANSASIRLLERIGLRFERMLRLSQDATELKLFAWEEKC